MPTIADDAQMLDLVEMTHHQPTDNIETPPRRASGSDDSLDEARDESTSSISDMATTAHHTPTTPVGPASSLADHQRTSRWILWRSAPKHFNTTWQGVGLLIGLLFTVYYGPRLYELTKWTAEKDYIEMCFNKELGVMDSSCPIEPPPVSKSKRSLVEPLQLIATVLIASCETVHSQTERHENYITVALCCTFCCMTLVQELSSVNRWALQRQQRAHWGPLMSLSPPLSIVMVVMVSSRNLRERPQDLVIIFTMMMAVVVYALLSDQTLVSMELDQYLPASISRIVEDKETGTYISGSNSNPIPVWAYEYLPQLGLSSGPRKSHRRHGWVLLVIICYATCELVQRMTEKTIEVQA